MALRKLDEYQKKAVESESNTVVTAGAGSGKTTVLAYRFVHLIESGQAEVGEILTLTFTRKAAAEMYERIYRLLLDKSGRAEDDERAGRLTRAVGDFDQAQISTLDSFCARIVRGAGGRFGIPGNFRQDEYAISRLLQDRALQFILENSEQRGLKDFLRSYGIETVLEELFIPLAEEEFHLVEELTVTELYQRQLSFLEKKLSQLVDGLEETRRWFSETELPADKKRINEAMVLITAQESPAALLAARDWTGLAELAAVRPSSFGGNIKDPLLLEGREHIRNWQSVTGEMQAILPYFLDQEVYRQMYRLLEEFRQRVNEAKRRAGVLSFSDVVEAAIRLLREDRQLRDFYKGRFTHIMIDEFQDNNDLQRQLLFLLAERSDRTAKGVPGPEDLASNKLFFVGDEKQSIYRFRNADVRV
ncbi:MAG TPA: DNA helicase UvrD, partial [Sediminispirochaeta sp.]|nr:DNA helicase UvrD [Sediminispirochaeta sp.]